jgi:hypothetical protein
MKAGRIKITGDLVLDLLRRAASGIPEDARCVNLHYEPDSDVFFLTLVSEGFPEVEPGDAIPLLDASVKTHEWSFKAGRRPT